MDKLPNADVVYWTSESSRMKAELERHRLLLHQAAAKLASFNALDSLRAEHHALHNKVAALQAAVANRSSHQHSTDHDVEMSERDSNRYLRMRYLFWFLS